MNSRNDMVPRLHPRSDSLRARAILTRALEHRLLAPEGLMAYGRGEAFDYLLGERTIPQSRNAIRAAAASLILAEHPVISVNGNVAAIAGNEIVRLSKLTGARTEINLFYRSKERIKRISKVLEHLGVKNVLGVDPTYQVRIPELGSERRKVDSRGIMKADLVLVPLEDGDRTESLRKLGKSVISIDLNPLSRTSKSASIAIIDDLKRVMPQMIAQVKRLNQLKSDDVQQIVSSFDNSANLGMVLRYIGNRINRLSREMGKKD